MFPADIEAENFRRQTSEFSREVPLH